MSAPATISKRHSSKSNCTVRAPKAKKSKKMERMALICVVDSEGYSVGYFVPLSRLPPIPRLKADLKERGSATQRGYYKGREFIRERDLTDDMIEEEDVGDILSHCIKPLATHKIALGGETFDYGPVMASVNCAFFAVVQDTI